MQFQLAVDDHHPWPEGQTFEFATAAAPNWIRRSDYVESVSARPSDKLDGSPWSNAQFGPAVPPLVIPRSHSI
jgi:hypothetical protein